MNADTFCWPITSQIHKAGVLGSCKVAGKAIMHLRYILVHAVGTELCHSCLVWVEYHKIELESPQPEAQSQTPEEDQTQITRFMGPTWGPSGARRPQMGPCWPHEPCYQGTDYASAGRRAESVETPIARVRYVNGVTMIASCKIILPIAKI